MSTNRAIADAQAAARALKAVVAIIGGVLDIGAAKTERVHVNTPDVVTSLGTAADGVRRYVVCCAGIVFTPGPNLIMPPATSLVGDVILFVSHGTGWRCFNYERADGKPLVAPVTFTLGQIVALAAPDTLGY
jgi:hypothetical protein